jgi:protoporphyrinogen oxidase
MKVAVVGGGLAGLCAALELSRAGAEVTVYEKYPNFGGLASAFEIAGTHLERFYHHAFSTDLDLLKLLDELGLSEKLQWSTDDSGSFYEGKTYPFSPAWRLLTFAPLNLLSRLRLAFSAKYLSLLKNYRPFDDVSAKEWIISHMGMQVWKVLWEPLFLAKFGAYTDKISMTWFYGRVSARFGPSKEGAPTGHLGYLLGSTQLMVDALEARLKAAKVRLLASTPVQRLIAENGAIKGIETKLGREDYDQVLITCATPLFLQMEGGILPEALRGELESFRYHGSVVAVLELKESLSPHYWLNILDSSLPFLAIIEHTKMIGPEHYQGRHLMYLARYLDTADPFFSLGKEQILGAFYEKLQRVFPRFERSMVSAAHVMRADYTQPIIELGYGKRLPPHRLPVKGLFLANMTQIYPEDRGMSYSIGMGRRVAKMMME